MYTTHHATAGLIIGVLTPAVTLTTHPIIFAGATAAAFASHYILDLFHEDPYEMSYKQLVLTQAFFFIVMAAIFSILFHNWYIAYYMVIANLPDFIDKPLTWMGKKSIFACHQEGWEKY